LGDFRKVLLVLIVAESSRAARRVAGADSGLCAFTAMSYDFNPKSCGAGPDRVDEPHFPLTLPSDLMYIFTAFAFFNRKTPNHSVFENRFYFDQ
jgi:hypothetical protein